ncbi:MAG: hypothetical protein ACI8W8_000061 [Rhodothermales bacterium]|jgi:uncharacterized protein (DUF58 family)
MTVSRIHNFTHRQYHRWYGVGRWLRYHITPVGRLVIWAALAAAAVGIDTNMAMAYQVFTLLVAVLLVAIAGCRLRRAKLCGVRDLPRHASVDSPLTYTLTLENMGSRSEYGLIIHEEMDDPRPSLAEFANSAEPADAPKNWFDRTMGFPRWRYLLRRREMVRVPQLTISEVAAGETEQLRVTVNPRRRGVIRFANFVAASPDPLGLVACVSRVSLPGSVVVLPKRYLLPPIDLPGSARYQLGGVALASSVGESEEFVGLRDYRPGDPLRHIHWRSWAKRGLPVVKEFQQEFFVRHALVLDTFGGGIEDAVFEEAVSVAASFACTVETHDSLLDLLFVGSQAHCVTAGRGVAHAEQLLEVLAAVAACHELPFATLPGLICQHADAVCGAICVLLAWDEARQDMVKQLALLGVPLLVYVITPEASLDLEPQLPPGDLRFLQLRVGSVQETLLAAAP